MATAAQIEANRRNAQKSSGPKTEKGKARVRCNALKHGMTARTTMPGLTHEDPDQLREKMLRLINDLQPSNEAELDQVRQAARLTLAIERADRFEMAHMNQRIRAAARSGSRKLTRGCSRRFRSLAAGCSTSRRRKRSSSPGSRPGPTTRGCWSPSSKPAPRAAAGCWRGGPNSASCWTAERRWDTPALLRFIRLQGKQVAESVYDPVLNVIFVAWDVLVPKFAAEEWENFREERFRTDPSFNHRQCWREIVARPSNAAECGRSSTRSSRTTSRTSRSCWPATRPSKRSRTPTGSTARRPI